MMEWLAEYLIVTVLLWAFGARTEWVLLTGGPSMTDWPVSLSGPFSFNRTDPPTRRG